MLSMNRVDSISNSNHQVPQTLNQESAEVKSSKLGLVESTQANLTNSIAETNQSAMDKPQSQVSLLQNIKYGSRLAARALMPVALCTAAAKHMSDANSATSSLYQAYMAAYSLSEAVCGSAFGRVMFEDFESPKSELITMGCTLLGCAIGEADGMKNVLAMSAASMAGIALGDRISNYKP